MDTEDILETVHTSHLGHRPHMRQDQIFSERHEAGTSGLEVAMVLRIVVDLRVSGVTKAGLHKLASTHTLRPSSETGLTARPPLRIAFRRLGGYRAQRI